MYMTDAQLAELGFGDDLDTAAQAAQDADLIYGYVAAHPAVSDDTLGQFAISQWGADDADARRSNALAVLALQGRLTHIEE